MTVDCTDIDQAVSNAETASAQAVASLQQGQPFAVANQQAVIDSVAIWLVGDIAKSFRRMALAAETMAAIVPQAGAPAASSGPLPAP